MTNQWNASKITDLSGKIAIVTGANSGLGLETTRELSRNHAKVYMACRNLEKAEIAFQDIKVENPDADIEIVKLNLGDLESVRIFSEKIHVKIDHLDLLINNAGVMAIPYRKTKDGFESQIGINHFGHYALTGLLMDLIRNAKNARVVNVSSLAHTSGVMNFDDLMFENGRKYTRFTSYSQSKLANLLFSNELQRYFESKNIDAISVGVHPGVADTSLLDHFKLGFVKKIFPFYKNSIQSSAKGALSSLRAATASDVSGGDFYGPDGNKGMVGFPIKIQSSDSSRNLEDAKKLWQVSKELTKVKYE